jgi:hypothetical protein
MNASPRPVGYSLGLGGVRVRLAHDGRASILDKTGDLAALEWGEPGRPSKRGGLNSFE